MYTSSLVWAERGRCGGERTVVVMVMRRWRRRRKRGGARSVDGTFPSGRELEQIVDELVQLVRALVVDRLR
jgi:hypothetical protein